ncbi:MAG: type II toxin-antitoxin system PemK/MazF family toxin [Clostridia bacterium]|nr:type II toxin-antitoxin system PemK/MazF family toxin [Clostridia bacterium]
MSKAQPWEIWWAYVAFDEGDGGKERPVLVLEDGTVYVIALMITSHEQRNVYGEYDITKWQSAGLKKPSTIRVTRKLELSEDDLIYKMGELQPFDIVLLMKYL